MAARIVPELARPPRALSGRSARAAVVAGLVAGVAFLHAATPAGPHALHWVHLAAQKLHYLPVLLAVAWFGPCGSLLATAAVTAVFGAHVLAQWGGDPMVQADQWAEVGNLWLVAALATLAASRLRRTLGETERAHEETLAGLALALELRERYTAGHSRRVRDYSLLLADALGLARDRRRDIGIGAWLHDVGKIGTPDAVLLKEGTPSPDEWTQLRRHPDEGAELLGAIESLRGARDLVRAHHERWDGSGYPRGLAGDAIPIEARIFAVADVLDALTTDRPYHRAASFDEATAEIRRGRGTHFDPRVVDAFEAIPFGRWAEAAARGGATLRRASQGRG